MSEARGFEPVTVDVHGVRTTVREAGPGDIEGILDLYGRLTPDDLYRRFFSGFTPSRGWVERWIDRSADGGAVLVALEEPTSDGAPPRIVGDAGYVRSGDVAELGMAVDPQRRGWLGPFLLDVLVEHARSQGVVGIVAEVMSGNRSMVALLRSRGCAYAPTDDPTTVRIFIGTSGDAPRWPDEVGRPHVLISGTSPTSSVARAAAGAGMGVLVCPGPTRGRLHPCPRISGGQCPLVNDADVIVVADDPAVPLAIRERLLEGRNVVRLDPQDRASWDAAVQAVLATRRDD